MQGPLAIVRSALSHTVQVTLFIFLVTLALVAVLEGAGEEALAGFLAGNETLAVFARPSSASFPTARRAWS